MFIEVNSQLIEDNCHVIYHRGRTYNTMAAGNGKFIYNERFHTHSAGHCHHCRISENYSGAQSIMNNSDSVQVVKKLNTSAKSSMPLVIVYVAMIVLFVLFCAGAILVTIGNGGMMGSGLTAGISWMWMPTLLFLTLGILLGWVIFKKKI